MAQGQIRRSTGERIFVSIIGLLFGLQFVLALSYPPDARLFPLIVCGVGFLLAVAMEFGMGLGEAIGEKLSPMSRRLLALALLAPPLYAAALWLFGFWIATAIADPAIAYLLGYRRPLVLVLVTASMTLTIGVLFPLVNVALPKAALFGRHFF